MDYEITTRSGRSIKYNQAYVEKYVVKESQRKLIEAVKQVLDMADEDRTAENKTFLSQHNDLVTRILETRRSRAQAKMHHEIQVDESTIVEQKCQQLASMIKNSKYCIVYTGAGLSTSANIPDYRGPSGLWTLLKKGIKVETPDFSQVQPTYSHMLLKRLCNIGYIKHIISQNCDGLHLRSGIGRDELSELHGNCFIEQCRSCNKDFMRIFDVTENTKFRKHNTGRYCFDCKHELNDTIIHFGEKLRNGLPYNWDEAREAVKKADCILCLGSSLKVLKHYTWLWPKNLKKSVQLCILNIQWTPKDRFAKLKINAYCDVALKLVAKYLGIDDVDVYSVDSDPLLALATRLNDEECRALKKPTIGSTCPVDNLNTNSWYSRGLKK